MISQKSQTIDDFYSLAECSGNDIKVVALLIDLIKVAPKAKTIHDLESLKVENYQNEINFLLDNLHINSLKHIAGIYHKWNS